MKPALLVALCVALALPGLAWPTPQAAALPPRPPAAAAPQVAPAPEAPVVGPALWVAGQNVVYYGGESWLGVSLADLDAARAKELHLPSVDGAEIKEVFPDSPAAKAGLKPGDVIVRFHGQEVISVRELTRMVREEPPNRTVAMSVMRGGRPVSFTVQIGRMNAASRRIGAEAWPAIEIPPMPNFHVSIPPMPAMPVAPEISLDGAQPLFRLVHPSAAILGIAVEDITGQLAHYFGVNADHAVLVRSVAAGGIADTAGLRAGDIILSLGDTKIGSVQALYSAIRQHEGAKSPLQVLRKGQPVTLQLPALAPHVNGANAEWPEQATAERVQAILKQRGAELGQIAHSDLQRLNLQLDAELARPQLADQLHQAALQSGISADMASRMRELQDQLQAARKQVQAEQERLARRWRDQRKRNSRPAYPIV